MVKLIGFNKKAQATEWVRKFNKKNKSIRKEFEIPANIFVTKFKIKKYMDKKRKKPIYIVSN